MTILSCESKISTGLCIFAYQHIGHISISVHEWKCLEANAYFNIYFWPASQWLPFWGNEQTVDWREVRKKDWKKFDYFKWLNLKHSHQNHFLKFIFWCSLITDILLNILILIFCQSQLELLINHLKEFIALLTYRKDSWGFFQQ